MLPSLLLWCLFVLQWSMDQHDSDRVWFPTSSQFDSIWHIIWWFSAASKKKKTHQVYQQNNKQSRFTSTCFTWHVVAETKYYRYTSLKGCENMILKFAPGSPPPADTWLSADRDLTSYLSPLYLTEFSCLCHYVPSDTPAQQETWTIRGWSEVARQGCSWPRNGPQCRIVNKFFDFSFCTD